MWGRGPLGSCAWCRPRVGRWVPEARVPQLGLLLPEPLRPLGRGPPSEGTSPELMEQRPAARALSPRPPGVSPRCACSAALSQPPATTLGKGHGHLLGRASPLGCLPQAKREATGAGGSASRPPGPQKPFSGVGLRAGGRSFLEGQGLRGGRRGAQEALAWARAWRWQWGVSRGPPLRVRPTSQSGEILQEQSSGRGWPGPHRGAAEALLVLLRLTDLQGADDPVDILLWNLQATKKA